MLRGATASLLALAILGWIYSADGVVKLTTLALLWVAISVVLTVGRCVCSWVGWRSDPGQLPFVDLITGYVVTSVFLFGMVLALPGGLTVWAAALAVGAWLVGKALGAGRSPSPRPEVADSRDHWADWIALLLAMVAATVWSHEARQLPDPNVSPLVYQVWQDVFYHARLISAFGQASGHETLFHISDATQPLAVYHYATYLLPALVYQVTGQTAVSLYVSVLLPFGVVLCALSAYVLVRNWFGAGAGLAALLAVVFLPDAFAQGFANKHYSYYFQMLVNVATPYGLACVALSWVFMFRGCRTGSVRHVLFAYLLGVLLVFFKAHLFFANSLFLMLYPMIQFPGLRAWQRTVLCMVAVGAFVGTIALAQGLETVPYLALDGSGVHVHFRNLNHYTSGSPLKDWMRHQYQANGQTPFVYGLGAAFLLAYAFGLLCVVFLLALVLIRWYGKRETEDRHVGWILAVFIGWLLSALFLSGDIRRIGTVDELIHRPFVWAYFLVAAWSAGALYFVIWGKGYPRSFRGGVLAISVCAAATVMLWQQAPGLQVFPHWKPGYRAIMSFDRCALQLAGHMRTHRRPNDLFLASGGDKWYFYTAHAEMQIYAGRSIYGPTRSARPDVLREVDALTRMYTEAQVLDFLRSRHIGWYIKDPYSQLQWPDSMARFRVMDCGGHELYAIPGA